MEKPGVLSIPLRRTAEGESCGIGLVLNRNGVRTGWNGPELNAPDVMRKVIFGNTPILRNGSFAVIDEKDGKKIPRHFGCKCDFRIVSDHTAASGKNFLRGRGFVHQYLNGLMGQVQTYGIPEVFQGKLRVRVKYRGEGKGMVRLATSALARIGEQHEVISSPGKWRDAEFLFDCSKNSAPLLLLYVFSMDDTLDMDDIRVERADAAGTGHKDSRNNIEEDK